MIYLTGDTHGDPDRLQSAKKLKSKDVLIVCGDFGFIWNGGKAEEKQLKKIGKQRYDTLFVEGCHDNYTLLEQYPVVTYKGGMARKISGNLYQLLRGEIYQIDGRNVFAFGGGDSGEAGLDYDETARWWPQEQPTVEEQNHALHNLQKFRGKIDVVVTHDAPGAIKRFIQMDDNRIAPIHDLLDTVAGLTKNAHWYFGRYHLDKIIPPRYTALYRELAVVQQADK
jgi:hypothetical protein